MNLIFIFSNVLFFLPMSFSGVPQTHNIVLTNFTLSSSLNPILIATKRTATQVMATDPVMETTVWTSSDENWIEKLSPDRTHLQIMPKTTKPYELIMNSEY